MVTFYCRAVILFAKTCGCKMIVFFCHTIARFFPENLPKVFNGIPRRAVVNQAILATSINNIYQYLHGEINIQTANTGGCHSSTFFSYPCPFNMPQKFLTYSSVFMRPSNQSWNVSYSERKSVLDQKNANRSNCDPIHIRTQQNRNVTYVIFNCPYDGVQCCKRIRCHFRLCF